MLVFPLPRKFRGPRPEAVLWPVLFSYLLCLLWKLCHHWGQPQAERLVFIIAWSQKQFIFNPGCFCVYTDIINHHQDMCFWAVFKLLLCFPGHKSQREELDSILFIFEVIKTYKPPYTLKKNVFFITLLESNNLKATLSLIKILFMWKSKGYCFCFRTEHWS